MSNVKDYSIAEMMAVVTARQIKNDDVVFIGIGIPLIAGVCALNTHAPDVMLIYEGGGIGAQSRRLAFSISDNPTTDNALGAASMWRVFGDNQRGMVTLGVIGGAEVDKFGNLNTSVLPGIDSYANPKVRLPGSGGSNDIASSTRNTIIMMRLQKGKFVSKVGFITSPGFLSGPGEREKAGLLGNGPKMVISDHGIFGFDEQTKEMYLEYLYPGVTVEKVRELVEWDLKVSDSLKTVEPPTEEELKVMRTIDPLGFILGKKSERREENFDEYYEKMKRSYEEVSLLGL